MRRRQPRTRARTAVPRSQWGGVPSLITSRGVSFRGDGPRDGLDTARFEAANTHLARADPQVELQDSRTAAGDGALVVRRPAATLAPEEHEGARARVRMTLHAHG